MQSIHNYINGQIACGSGQRFSNVYNPATGEVTARVVLSSSVDVNEAVTAALEAFPKWSAMSPLKRARAMNRFRDLLERNAGHLATVISTEHGKVHADALGEVQRGMEVVEFACAAPHLLKGEFTESVATGVDSHSVRQPLGVVAGITPFNFPAMVPMWMFPIAVACGNTFILKPSERDPSAALFYAELMREADFPPGVFNVVQGDKAAVDALLEHPQVSALSFVGSTPIARYIYSTAAANGKRVQALGGAKNHMVVMPDADLDNAVDALMGAVYGSAGERCMAISVVVPVGKTTADSLRERLSDRIKKLKVGPGCDADADMGPLVTREHLNRVRGYIDKGEAEGADLVIDGRTFRMTQQGYEKGFFLGPTLFDRVRPDMTIYREEIFGPVLCMVRTESYGDAAQLINRNPYGNGVAIFTRDGDSATAFARDIQVGMVGVNVPIPVPMAFHSFGGWKTSLFGDHHMHGMEGVRFYTKLKTVTTRWPKGVRTGASYAMPTLE